MTVSEACNVRARACAMGKRSSGARRNTLADRHRTGCLYVARYAVLAALAEIPNGGIDEMCAAESTLSCGRFT
jgi:hypothetical protein